MEELKITFEEKEEVLYVEELINLLKSLNNICFKLVVLYYYKFDKEELFNLFIGTGKLRIPEYKKLEITYLSKMSPLEIKLSGLAEVIKQLRELLKDLLFRNKLEKQLMEEELKSKRLDNFKKSLEISEDIQKMFLKYIDNDVRRLERSALRVIKIDGII